MRTNTAKTRYSVIYRDNYTGNGGTTYWLRKHTPYGYEATESGTAPDRATAEKWAAARITEDAS